MPETWLKPNRRAMLLACIPPILIVTLGVWLAVTSGDGWLSWIWAALAAIGVVTTVALLIQLRQPRIAYGDGRLLFYLRSGQPIAVPVQVVEAFFLGQGPAKLPGGTHARQQTMNLVARLAQRETDWARRDVKPALGNWCDGYITIRGTWCEPLNNEVVRRLNRRLKEVTSQAANGKR